MKRIERIITGKVIAVSPYDNLIQVKHHGKEGTTVMKLPWLDMTPEQLKGLRNFKSVTVITTILACEKETDEE